MPGWNDGLVPHGSRTVKFYSNSAGATDANGTTFTVLKGIYIIESGSYSRPQYEQGRYDEVRNPNGGFGVDDFVTGSMVVQLATTATAYVAPGDAFATILPDSPGGTAEGFVVTSIDDPESQGDIRKQSCRVRKLYKCTLPTTYP